MTKKEREAGEKLRLLPETLKMDRERAYGILLSLWIWALDNANQNGRITDPDKIPEAFTDGADCIAELLSAGWLEVRDGKIYIPDWNSCRTVALAITKRSVKRNGYSDEFEDFWAAYPRKVRKEAAFQKYTARLNDGYVEEDLQMAAENYAEKCQREHTEEKFIMHPATFLGSTFPFADYMQEEEKPAVRAETENPFAAELEAWKDLDPGWYWKESGH